MLWVVSLSIVILSVIMQRFAILSGILQKVVILSVIMLCHNAEFHYVYRNDISIKSSNVKPKHQRRL